MSDSINHLLNPFFIPLYFYFFQFVVVVDFGCFSPVGILKFTNLNFFFQINTLIMDFEK